MSNAVGFNRCKYVVMRGGSVTELAVDTPILFPDFLTHLDVVRKLLPFTTAETIRHNVLGAGFIQFNADGISIKAKCYGESVSLGVKMRPERDTTLVNTYMGFGV